MNFKLCAFADEADKNIDGQIKALLENDIRLLEIRGVDGENISEISLQKAKEVREKLDDGGIVVWSVGSPFGKIKITDDFEKHFDSFKYGIEKAHILGAKNIRMFSFFVPKEEADACFDKVMERLEKFRIAAKDSGVLLCHENEKGIFGDTADRCRLIHDTLPEIKAVFDPANFVQCGENTKLAFEKLSPYVKYMHIKDALTDGTVVPAGKGVGNIEWLLSKYSGEVLTLEPHLSVFKGLDKLEADEKTNIDQFKYKTPKIAFDVAVTALKNIIE